MEKAKIKKLKNKIKKLKNENKQMKNGITKKIVVTKFQIPKKKS